MISINKSVAIAILSLVVGVGCSDNNTASISSNPVQEKAPQAATQPSNPVTIEEKNTGNSQANSSQQPVEAKVDNLKPVNNTLIIPGKSVGPVTSETTRADLVKIFGESNLKDETILQAEGTISVPATKVKEGTPSTFTVFWKDNTRNKIEYIKGFGSQWKTSEGIGVGTTLKELRQKLGEFKLTGFGWDYGGLVNLEGTKLSEYQGKLSLRIDPADENAYGKYPKQYASVSGDIELSSTNPNLEPLNVRVNQMTVNFAE